MKPIIFSSEMVRAILDGRKTMTRRVIQGFGRGFGYRVRAKNQLWVRESWRTRREWDHLAPSELPIKIIGKRCKRLHPEEAPRLDYIHYEASQEGGELRGKLRPSIFMCQWMSRITLEITDVRVERLHDISEEDAKAEGYDLQRFHPSPSQVADQARYWFKNVWKEINGSDSWLANPWVWVISFKVIKPEGIYGNQTK